MGSCSCGGNPPGETLPHPVVVVKTGLGTMEITLDAAQSPSTVANFLAYVRDGFYDNTVFHRVEPGILIQGGGFTVGMAEKKTRRPVRSEARNGRKNTRGTVAMARLDRRNSATSQFFINLKDNPDFDHRDDSEEGWGYAVFGVVTKGMEVADAIAAAGGSPPVVVYSVTVGE